MSERFRQIARDVSRDSFDTSDYPELSRLKLLRGDLGALHRELLQEAAHSMGSSARRLEASLEKLRLLEDELDTLESADPRRADLVQRFNAQREEVLLRLHYVRIQREALGFLRHTELDEHYPVPPRKE